MTADEARDASDKALAREEFKAPGRHVRALIAQASELGLRSIEVPLTGLESSFEWAHAGQVRQLARIFSADGYTAFNIPGIGGMAPCLYISWGKVTEI